MSGLRVHYSAFDVVPSPKGASTHITAFVEGLAAAGAEVELVCVGNGLLPESGHYAGARVQRIGKDTAETFLGRALEFGESAAARLRRAGRGAYQVCHFRNAWCGLPIVEAAAELGYRTVFEVNGLPSIELKHHYPALRGSATLDRIRQREILTLLQADAVICPSRVTAAFLESLGIEPERLTVIPNGMDPAQFVTTPLPPPRATAQLLYVGTLADWQGLPLLLEALALVRQRHAVQLRIVGSGRARQRRRLERCTQRFALEGAVSVLQPIEQQLVPALIADADLCLAPLSYNERNVTQGCCPLKVIEYMACGRPVVAANLPVVRELVRDGVDGLLFEPDSASELARSILRVLEQRELALHLAQSAARRAHNQFTWHRAQQALLAVYDDLLGTTLRSTGRNSSRSAAESIHSQLSAQ